MYKVIVVFSFYGIDGYFISQNVSLPSNLANLAIGQLF